MNDIDYGRYYGYPLQLTLALHCTNETLGFRKS